MTAASWQRGQTVNSQPVTFKINALGQRVQKATVSTTTHYHYDLAGHIIGEANGSTGANTVEYVWMEGMLLIAEIGECNQRRVGQVHRMIFDNGP